MVVSLQGIRVASDGAFASMPEILATANSTQDAAHSLNLMQCVNEVEADGLSGKETRSCNIFPLHLSGFIHLLPLLEPSMSNSALVGTG